MSPLRAAAAACSLFVLLAVGAGTASAARVTTKGIGQARLGITTQELRDRLGDQSSERKASQRGVSVYSYRRQRLEVKIFQGRVVGVHTDSRAHTALGGVRVGMSKSEMRRRVREAHCTTKLVVCTVDRGAVVLEFAFRRGRVAKLGVSR